MRKFLLLFLGIFLSFLSFSQEYQDVIYLKSGSVIKGEIIQKGSDNYIIKTSDGQLYTFNLSEIEQVLKEQSLNLKDYGGTFSYGISIGGGGFVGVPTRFHGREKFAFEMSLHYRPGIIYAKDYWGNSETYFVHSAFFSLGANYHFGKYFKEKRQKVKLNGITLKAGAGTGSFDTYLVGVGWIHESFKKFNYSKSFSFELGPSFAFTDFKSSNDETYSGGTVAIYWKVQWNWFKK